MAGFDALDTRGLRGRLLFCGMVFLALIAAVMLRAVQLQVLRSDELTGMARGQSERELAVKARRGSIVDSRKVDLALSVDADSVFVDPTQLDDEARGSADRLAKALGLKPADVEKRFERDSSFVWLKRRVSPAEGERVRALKLKGVGVVREYRRFYPQKELGAHLLGSVGIDDVGLEGLEREFDAYLRGAVLEMRALQDVRGKRLFMEPVVPSAALAGASIELTLDSSIQLAAETALNQAVATTGAVSGMALVMDPATGALLALANAPTFNANAPQKSDRKRNRAVTDVFEPGSTTKAFLVAAALEDKLIREDSRVEVGDGRMTIGRKTIRDSHRPKRDRLTLSEMLATSSNVGTARLGLALGPERLVDWMKRFGFAERTGIELPGEGRGVLQDPKRMGEIGTATTAFGQGMSATPLQMVTALSVLANGGQLMRPFLVRRVVAANGEVLIDNRPQVVRQVVAPEVAQAVARAMEAVTQPGGTGKLAALPGVRVAGKTGTAQKAKVGERGYSDKRFSSFMGFAPAEAPRVAIYVALDEPSSDVYGGIVAAPVFREIAQEALRQLGVAPSAQAGNTRAASPEPSLAETDFSEGFIDEGEWAALDLTVADEARTGEGMVVPDVRGLSARAALRVLGARALEVEFDGSGRVVKQRPAPGARVSSGTTVRVVLEAS